MAFSWTDGFETDFGNWQNVTGDDRDWTRQSGGTPSTGTGPSGAATGSFYVYTETSSPVVSSDEFILESNVIDGSANIVTVITFNEHMTGGAMDTGVPQGTLYVEAFDGTTWNTIYTQAGINGATADGLNWQAKDALSAVANLDAAAGGPYTNSDLQLRFRFVVSGSGSAWQNDCAIDDIVVTGVDRNEYEQEGYRWRNDDGSEIFPGGASYRQAQDVVDSVGKETNIRLRVLVDATGDPVAEQATLQYKRDDEAATEWRDV